MKSPHDHVDDLDGLFADPNAHDPGDDLQDSGPDLDEMKKKFRQAFDASEEQRRHAREDRDYYDGPKQIDAATRAKLRKRNAPETYVNKISKAIAKVLGILDSNESSPEAVARNDDGDDAATIVTEILRYQADKARLQNALHEAQQDFVVEGIGVIQVEVDDKDNCDVSHVRYDNFYYDPHSLAQDFCDASYMIHAYWTSTAAVKRKWPQFADRITDGKVDGEGPEDQPNNRKYWYDPAGKRTMVVDCYYVDDDSGKWMRAIYTADTVLEHGPSLYQDDQGEPICPIIAVSYSVMRDGERKGLVRDWVPLQRMINGLYATIHRLAISNRVGMVSNGEGSPADRDLARREAQRTDAAMPQGWTILAGGQQLTNMAQELAAMNREIEEAIPSNQQLAQAGANTSGRARQMMAQAGLADLSRAFGRIEDFEERIYRNMWFVARQYMTDQTMMMVTDDAGVRQKLVINDPITEMQTQMHPVMQPAVDPQTGQPATDPQTGAPVMQQAQHPLTGQPLHRPVNVQVQTGTKNHIAKMDMNITLKVVQLADTLRGEAKQDLMEWSGKTGISPLNPAFKLLIQISDIPDKAEMLKMWEDCSQEAQQAAAPQQAQQAQAQQHQQAVAEATVQAKVAKEQAAAQRDQTLAVQHQVQTQSMQLDNAWKALQLRDGKDPNGPSF